MHPESSDGRSGSDERRVAIHRPGDPATREDILRVYERERARLSYDLHDGPAQEISAALLQVRLLDGSPPEQLREGLGELTELLNAALDEMYELIEQLHSRSIDREGLIEKIEAQLDEFGKRSGVSKTFTVEGTGNGYSPSLQIAVFRIVQEALSNVRQHAEASNVSVELDLSQDVVRCSIEDDGRGFDMADVDQQDDDRESYGLAGMQERAAFLGGNCDIVASPGGGTKVLVSLPVWRGE
jgi:two-component system sensor histidine kinase DegS